MGRGFQTPTSGGGSGVDISDADAIESRVLEWNTFYAGTLPKKTGTMPQVSLDPNSNDYPAGFHGGDDAGLTDLEPTLIPENILYGISIFGVLGTATQWIYNLIIASLSVPSPSVLLDIIPTLATAHEIDETPSIPVPSVVLTETSIAPPSSLDGFVAHVQVPLADTDETAAANEDTPDDMDLLPVSLSGNGDGCYFGLDAAFSWLCLIVSTPGVGSYNINWKYWNGTQFVVLTTFNDSTGSFKTAGVVRMQFVPPNDWTDHTIDGIDAFWVKAEVDSGGMTTQPKGQQAWVGAYSA
jgi:hypothetical protein